MFSSSSTSLDSLLEPNTLSDSMMRGHNCNQPAMKNRVETLF
jgi:hypothetical protein